jgi:hypothetical protein
MLSNLPMVMSGISADNTYFPSHEYQPNVIAEAAMPERVVVKALLAAPMSKERMSKERKLTATIGMIFPKWAFAVNESESWAKQVRRDTEDFKSLTGEQGPSVPIGVFLVQV